jgi:molybdopterin converting factor small subunit
MARVTVLFFGAAADAAGTRESPFDAGDNATAGAAITSLIEQHPALTRHKLLFAVNEEYVDAQTPLADGDTLAVFTAVSGG